MIKAVIFDCFGVIITGGLDHIVSEIRTRDPAKANRIKSVVYAANKGDMDAVASRVAIAAELGMTPAAYADAIKRDEFKDQAMLDYIKTLRASYKTGLISNILRGGLESRFPGGQLAEYFDAVVASGDIGIAKPDPRIYKLTAEKLGVEPAECVFIDDRPEYTDGANAAGMRALLYTNFPALKAELRALLAA